ncbi:hypothetical protein VPH35_014737 [Triticum aestivum]|nr:peroxidase 5-like [Triticum aestivum]
MAMGGMLVAVVVVAGLLLHAATVAEAQTLRVGYYDQTCNRVESIVFEEVQKAWNADRSMPAALLRLHFHDCFVNGCDGSVLLESGDNQAEKNAPPNQSLRGFEVIDRAKARIEAVCKETVSCADILAYAARDSVRVATGGYEYKVPGGRPDGTVSRASMANSDLPPHKQRNVDLLAQYFSRKGLSMDDVVVLSGAHTLGVTRCGTFDYRLMSDQDKGMNATFRNELRRQCGYDANRVVSLDAGSPYGFDTSYYATCWPTAPCSSPTPRSTRPGPWPGQGAQGRRPARLLRQLRGCHGENGRHPRRQPGKGPR